MSEEKREAAKRIAADLFTTGAPNGRATTLRMIDKDGRYMGGWCEGAVVDRVEAILTPDLTTPSKIDAEIRRLQDRIDELLAIQIPLLPPNAGGGQMATDVHGEQK